MTLGGSQVPGDITLTALPFMNATAQRKRCRGFTQRAKFPPSAVSLNTSICDWLAAPLKATVGPGRGGRFLMERVRASHVTSGAATEGDVFTTDL